MVNALVESQAEVEAETLCNTLSDTQAMVHTVADFRKHWSTRLLKLYLRVRQKRKATN